MDYDARELTTTAVDWRENVKDLAAGAAGGVAQVLIGQPFDIVKVRLQTQGGGSALSAARNIYIQEGPRSFYKGTLVPLVGVGACVSIQFAAFHGFRQLIESYNFRNDHTKDPTLSLPQFYLAGGAAGVTNSIISGPVEHIRIRLQTQPHGAGRLYSGPWDCARKIIRTVGPAGLYRGQVVTLFREFHGYGVWFAAYEGLLGILQHHEQKKREELPNWQIAVCGGLAGEALWLLSHPLDVIKSKMQSDGFGSDRKYSSMGHAFKETWVVGGVRGLFQGLGPALLRAMPVSAGTFATVELVRKMLL
ncbi:mitochondrial carrier protein [Aspergillus piperis CBS 112811]|uniref:Mitochondrial carrier protein n=1 Tax=Aspergillus piperis CBS 112811 TaxID=1448313 RepID=A0A8G1R5Z3_9EURO|nr:mitochondrial carrier protein [Aspergillus piperis CBS 112811]RAH59112.1 mitochondrial carrier protein [Aspergillus piperis CBS 112811]